MARPLNNALEFLAELEGNGVLHRMVRRNIPGDPSDGLVSSWAYRVCKEGKTFLLRDDEECLGCIAKRILDEQG